MRVYVGTYAKYNNGDLAGKWLDLGDYSDKEEFYEACKELHSNEEDPEFMFQDWEGIPEGMISESQIDAEAFEVAQMDEEDRELLTVYRSHVDQEGTLEQARDSFRGTYRSPEDFAEEFTEDTTDMTGIPDCVRYHINWEGVARDMRLGGDVVFVEHGGETWVFWSV